MFWVGELWMGSFCSGVVAVMMVFVLSLIPLLHLQYSWWSLGSDL